jgi:C1A family cysteine protease/copper chaperone CopZ
MGKVSPEEMAKRVLVEVATGKKIRIGGMRPSSSKPPNATKFKAQGGSLPEKVDLRTFMTPIEDQSQANSCSANAVVGLFEYLHKRGAGKHKDISRLFVYWNARKFDGIKGDEGSSISNNIRVLEELGGCPEKVWPYDLKAVNKKPDGDAYQEAKRYSLEGAREVSVNLKAMKACLAEGYPFAFGLDLFNTFDKAGKAGVVPMPDLNTAKGRETHGSHAMLAVGYSDKDRVFVVRNSWGDDWGDKGYCYIPYDYLANPDLCSDCWTGAAIEDADLSEDVTYDDDDGFELDYGSIKGDSGYLFNVLSAIEDAVAQALVVARENADEDDEEEDDSDEDEDEDGDEEEEDSGEDDEDDGGDDEDEDEDDEDADDEDDDEDDEDDSDEDEDDDGDDEDDDEDDDDGDDDDDDGDDDDDSDEDDGDDDDDSDEDDDDDDGDDDDDDSTYVYVYCDGLTSQAAARKIKARLMAIEGVEDVECDVAEAYVTVYMDPEVLDGEGLWAQIEGDELLQPTEWEEDE